jgi:hypothetical protein
VSSPRDGFSTRASRHTHKTTHAYRDGVKAHVAAEPDTGLVTGYDLTPGNTSDAETAPGLLEDEPGGIEVLGDSEDWGVSLYPDGKYKRMTRIWRCDNGVFYVEYDEVNPDGTRKRGEEDHEPILT